MTLAIYDPGGRLVRLFFNGEVVEAGLHEVPWDGTNEHGQHVASGTYSCRLTAGGQEFVRNLCLLR